MDEQCKEKTNVRDRFGTFQVEFILFEIMNARNVPMSDGLDSSDYIFRQGFLYDVVVFSKNLKGHLKYVKKVLQILKGYGLEVKAITFAFCAA